MYYSQENIPEYGYNRFEKYINTNYYGLSDQHFYVAMTKDELIEKVQQDINNQSCQRTADNFDHGILDNYDNFWTYFCPKQGLITQLENLNL